MRQNSSFNYFNFRGFIMRSFMAIVALCCSFQLAGATTSDDIISNLICLNYQELEAFGRRILTQHSESIRRSIEQNRGYYIPKNETEFNAMTIALACLMLSLVRLEQEIICMKDNLPEREEYINGLEDNACGFAEVFQRMDDNLNNAALSFVEKALKLIQTSDYAWRKSFPNNMYKSPKECRALRAEVVKTRILVHQEYCNTRKCRMRCR